MLVITRKENEALVIETGKDGEVIEIKMLSIDGQVKLGIDAPKNCKIWRRELYNTVETNRKASLGTSPDKLKGLTALVTGKEDAPK